MNGLAAQSWFDLVVMPPMDPRSIIQTASLQDNGGAMQAAKFARLNGWLTPGPWVNSIISLNITPGNVTVPNAYDFSSQEEANSWNTLHQMTAVSPTSLPTSASRKMFFKAGTAFVNNVYIDFAGGKTSSNILLSFIDNSATSGDFQNAAGGTVPCFQFPTGATFGGTGRNLQVTLLATGRFNVGLLVMDNTGNFSMYEMEWIVLA